MARNNDLASDKEAIEIINRHLKAIANLIAWHMRLWHEVPESIDVTASLFWKLAKSGIRSKHEVAVQVNKLSDPRRKAFFKKLHESVKQIFSEIKESKSSHAPSRKKTTPSPQESQASD